jgi:outer membrane protein assembly factor BamD (BamD/ComL family)
MRTFIIVCAVIFLAGIGARDADRNGAFERFLDTHPHPQRNAAIEYYWGILVGLANHAQSAHYRLHRVVEKYPQTRYAPLAWAELIDRLFDEGKRPQVLEESAKFLSQYPDHFKAEIIKKRVYYIQNES